MFPKTVLEALHVGRKGLLALLLMLVAVLSGIWLAVLEFRTNDELIDEVERGLRTDAALFTERIAAYLEDETYEKTARLAVERPGFLLQDSTASNGFAYGIEWPTGTEAIIEYPFFIDLMGQRIYVGQHARFRDEVARLFQPETLLAHAPELYGHIVRGQVPSPYGPFHYVYMIDVTRGGDIVLRGVKINASYVARTLIPAAFERLKQDVIRERGHFPTHLFGIEVHTSDTLFRFASPLYRQPERKGVGVYRRALTPEGLFSNWYVQVWYLNQLRAHQRGRYFLIFLLLLISVGGIVMTAHMAIRAMELNRIKTAFVSNVSHELKTPLAKIRLFNEMLARRRWQSEEQQQRYHRVIEQECERLGLLVDNVLDFSRMERGQMAYTFEVCNPLELVEEVAETFRLLYGGRGYDVAVTVKGNIPLMRLDAGAVKQALINLMDNAVKYSQPHTIRVTVAVTDAHFYISVTDAGIGIPKDKIRRIFKPFYRIDSHLAQRVAGSGLGLSLVQYIMEAHQGHVEVQSQPGKGSTFTLVFPLERIMLSVEQENKNPLSDERKDVYFRA